MSEAMTGTRNRIGVGVSAGNLRTVPDPDAAPGSLAPRLGFVLDVVSYGRRGAPQQKDIDERLRTLVAVVLADIEAERADTEPNGYGRLVVLPAGTDPTRALPALLMAMEGRLGQDNARFRDRMRLRMAIGSGLVGVEPAGLSGPLKVDLNRMADCPSLRNAVDTQPDADLLVLISDAVYDDVIRPGFVPPDLGPFRRVEVSVPEFTAVAWLRGRY